MVYLLLHKKKASKGHGGLPWKAIKHLLSDLCRSWHDLHLGEIKMKELLQTLSKVGVEVCCITRTSQQGLAVYSKRNAAGTRRDWKPVH